MRLVEAEGDGVAEEAEVGVVVEQVEVTASVLLRNHWAVGPNQKLVSAAVALG